MAQLVTSLLFPCPPASYTIDSFPGELIWVPRVPVERATAAEERPEVSDGGGGAGTGEPGDVCATAEPDSETVPCLLLPYESARFLIIFFHSNAEDLGRCRWFCHFLRDQFQVHVLAVEYPGYGVCPGPPSKEGVIANALSGLDFVTQSLGLPLEQIKVFGRSIGTGPALALAARVKLAGLILVTPFLSIRQLFADRLGPLSYFVDEWFLNDEEILKVRCPTMFVHGRKDIIIPHHHSEQLFKACKMRKLFVNPTKMEHNTNLTTDVSFLIVPMFRFFALPDYSFQELKVPAWAYDKKRSALYRRPAMEVCSSHFFVPAIASGPEAVGLSNPVPEGDDAEEIVDPSAFLRAAGVKGHGRGSYKPQLEADGAVPPGVVLTHPTVRHVYKATKRSYDFQATVVDAELLERAEHVLCTPEELAAVKRWPLGPHASASCPVQAQCHPKGLAVVWPGVCGERVLGCERWSCMPCTKAPQLGEVGFPPAESPRILLRDRSASPSRAGGPDADAAAISGVFGSRLRG
eukprot:CAMPEP_0204163894 /NCGR_PEP_ID=MMETSP0361-20130328/36785_1 /ASSEMBLY_ACC=CAM_ASM_000343 /TAXON_ID=268821 /ORGANISM="Scrippsiella Hangoei, Strain SHTV-5" /LENGTH=519 /DNA_ID=CAMNT_0051120667 /DNA_START=96 /DNA_END=1652 /DNA_ORIENTATION=-